jgi:hypothetical protein
LVGEIAKLSVDEILEKLDISKKYEYGQKVAESLEKSKSEDLICELIKEDELLQAFCPVCQLEVVSEGDMKRYLIKVSDISTDKVFQHIKSANKRRKKLYDHEYIAYVCGELGVNTVKLTSEIQSKFSSYKEFIGFIR